MNITMECSEWFWQHVGVSVLYNIGVKQNRDIDVIASLS